MEFFFFPSTSSCSVPFIFFWDNDVFIWGNLWSSSQQKRTRAQTVAAENQPINADGGGADNNDRTSDASDQADRESSPENLEEARPPKTKRNRMEGTSSAAHEVSDQSLIGI